MDLAPWCYKLSWVRVKKLHRLHFCAILFHGERNANRSNEVNIAIFFLNIEHYIEL